MIHGLRRLLAILALVTVLVACGSGSSTAVGIVTDVESRSLTEVDGFTIRTEEGTFMTFRIGNLELDAGAFPASHLHEHLATAQPIAIAYRAEPGGNIAYRLVDAPWAQP
ncbi:MAG TPA: hypothetical protein VLM76_03570 [Patescibacteria group bacterium]|nr:hypothetical protein [Patescibacteria group bacterium]